MATLDKTKPKATKHQEKLNDDGKLYREVMASTPRHKSSAEALIACEKRLEQLAKKFGLSPSELFHEAETSKEFKEEYLEVLSLNRQIHYFRNK